MKLGERQCVEVILSEAEQVENVHRALPVEIIDRVEVIVSSR